MSEDAGIPYIGSKISLISKSDIRYEGTLYTINMEESSIALKDVVSHGTEGRRIGGPQVPPSSEVYEYIIFKGDDIKDLTVLGPGPAAAPPAPVMNDPAVLSVGSYAPPTPSPPAPPAYGNAWSNAPAPATQAYTALYGSSQWGPPSNNPTYARPPPPTAAPAPPAPVAQKVAPQVQLTPANPRPAAPERPAQPPPKPANYAQAAGARPQAPSGGRGAGAPPPSGGRGAGAPPAGGRGGYNGGRGGPPAGGRGAHHHHHAPASSAPRAPAPPAPAPLPVPTEDFNFEEQNAKFKKDELVKEVAKELSNSTYMKDEFFDGISCETLERMNLGDGRADGRQRAADARRLDMETFGGLGGLRHNYGGRGRGRGGPHGGRGGPGGPSRGGYGGGRGMRPQSTGMPSGGRGGRH